MAIIITPNALPAVKINAYYEKYLEAAGGTVPYTFTVVSGELPPGVTMSPDGAIFGTPSVGGIFDFTVEVVDGNNETATKDYSIVVESLVITPASGALPPAVVGTAYTQKSTVTNSAGSCVWNYSGTLPSGLQYTAQGYDYTLSGTPVGTGTYNWEVIVSDSDGFIGTAQYTLVIGFQLAPNTLPNATNGDAYSETITATGNVGPCDWSHTGQLPPGLSISSLTASQGELSGTIGAAGNWTFTIIATDQTGATGYKTYSIQTFLSFDPQTVPDSTVSVPYSQVVTAMGGTAPYQYTWLGNTPPGITYSANFNYATFEGTPTAAGTYTGTLQAIDKNDIVGFRAYTFTTELFVVDGVLPSSNTGNPYLYNLQASGGTAPYTWLLTSGQLPPGLVLNSATGKIEGTVSNSAYGDYAFTLSVSDNHSPQNTGTGDFTISVGLGFLPESISNRTVGVAFADPITVQTTSAGPFAFSITSGSLPAGVTLAQDGTGTCVIQGTPTAISNSTFTLSVEDTVTSEVGSQIYSLRIVTADLIVVPATLPEGVAGSNYSVQYETAGGVAPYQYGIVQGTLPTGITLSNSGLLSGVPTVSSLSNITLEVMDSLSSTVRKSYTLAVAATALQFTTGTTLPPTKQGVSYTTQITASGGFTPYTFAIVSGRLPTGLTLSPTGTISGIPTAQGVFLVGIRVTDQYGATATSNFSLSVERNEIEVLPVTIPIAREGVEYSVQFEASGAEPPYSFSLYAGALPYGLSLSSSGLLSGTPTLEGIYQFIIEVTAGGVVSTRTYQLVVYPVAPDQALIVTVGGIPQKLGIDYTILTRDPVSIQFAVPPPEGVIVEMKVYRGHTWTDPGSHTDGAETLTYYGPLAPDRTYSALNSEINTQ